MVTPAFCPQCGRPAPPAGDFCPSCGARPRVDAGSSPSGSTAAGVPLGAQVAPAPRYAPFLTGSSGVGGVAAPDRAATQSAMTDVTIASVLGLIGGTLSLFELSGSSSFRLLTTPSASSGATYSLPALFLVAGLVGASLVLGLLGLWLYRSAFLTLSVADRSFSGPATLVLLGILGILFVVVSGSALLAAILRAVYCSGVANPISTSCVNYGEVALLAVAVFGAAIVAVIGYIGLLVGIWRLGTRFDDGLFKAGAVLMLFPLLNLVGSILVLLAARSARRRHGIL